MADPHGGAHPLPDCNYMFYRPDADRDESLPGSSVPGAPIPTPNASWQRGRDAASLEGSASRAHGGGEAAAALKADAEEREAAYQRAREWMVRRKEALRAEDALDDEPPRTSAGPPPLPPPQMPPAHALPPPPIPPRRVGAHAAPRVEAAAAAEAPAAVDASAAASEAAMRQLFRSGWAGGANGAAQIPQGPPWPQEVPAQRGGGPGEMATAQLVPAHDMPQEHAARRSEAAPTGQQLPVQQLWPQEALGRQAVQPAEAMLSEHRQQYPHAVPQSWAHETPPQHTARRDEAAAHRQYPQPWPQTGPAPHATEAISEPPHQRSPQQQLVPQEAPVQRTGQPAEAFAPRVPQEAMPMEHVQAGGGIQMGQPQPHPHGGRPGPQDGSVQHKDQRQHGAHHAAAVQEPRVLGPTRKRPGSGTPVGEATEYAERAVPGEACLNRASPRPRADSLQQQHAQLDSVIPPRRRQSSPARPVHDVPCTEHTAARPEPLRAEQAECAACSLAMTYSNLVEVPFCPVTGELHRVPKAGAKGRPVGSPHGAGGCGSCGMALTRDALLAHPFCRVSGRLHQVVSPRGRAATLPPTRAHGAAAKAASPKPPLPFVVKPQQPADGARPAPSTRGADASSEKWGQCPACRMTMTYAALVETPFCAVTGELHRVRSMKGHGDSSASSSTAASTSASQLTTATSGGDMSNRQRRHQAPPPPPLRRDAPPLRGAASARGACPDCGKPMSSAAFCSKTGREHPKLCYPKASAAAASLQPPSNPPSAASTAGSAGSASEDVAAKATTCSVCGLCEMANPYCSTTGRPHRAGHAVPPPDVCAACHLEKRRHAYCPVTGRPHADPTCAPCGHASAPFDAAAGRPCHPCAGCGSDRVMQPYCSRTGRAHGTPAGSDAASSASASEPLVIGAGPSEAGDVVPPRADPRRAGPWKQPMFVVTPRHREEDDVCDADALELDVAPKVQQLPLRVKSPLSAPAETRRQPARRPRDVSPETAADELDLSEESKPKAPREPVQIEQTRHPVQTETRHPVQTEKRHPVQTETRHPVQTETRHPIVQGTEPKYAPAALQQPTDGGSSKAGESVLDCVSSTTSTAAASPSPARRRRAECAVPPSQHSPTWREPSADEVRERVRELNEHAARAAAAEKEREAAAKRKLQDAEDAAAADREQQRQRHAEAELQAPAPHHSAADAPSQATPRRGSDTPSCPASRESQWADLKAWRGAGGRLADTEGDMTPAPAPSRAGTEGGRRGEAEHARSPPTPPRCGRELSPSQWQRTVPGGDPAAASWEELKAAKQYARSMAALRREDQAVRFREAVRSSQDTRDLSPCGRAMSHSAATHGASPTRQGSLSVSTTAASSAAGGSLLYRAGASRARARLM